MTLSSLTMAQAGDRGNWHDGRDNDGRGGFHQRNAAQLSQRNENIDRRYYKRQRDRHRGEASRRYHERFIARRDRYDERYDRYDGPSHIRRLGTYAGSISAYRDRGNGIYFDIDRDEGYGQRRARSKVIVVSPGRDNCSFESGVCVVRP